MSTTTVEHVYQYNFESRFWNDESISEHNRLELATEVVPSAAKISGKVSDQFFDGVLLNPKRAASLLCGVAEIVAARFNNPNWQRLADPVITSDGQRLRFEGFSSCCSAYVRADFLPEALEGRWIKRGTTNVDFNSPMIAALRSIRTRDYIGFTVGGDTVTLSQGGRKTVERKVSLPARWLKGFVEIQAYQSRMLPLIEVSGLQARNFLYSIPRTKSRTPLYVLPSGQGLRLSRIAGRGGVQAAGLERLRVLESLIQDAISLRIYGDEETGASAWEVVFPDARFHLIISADVWRGFSGEGQVLETLVENRHADFLEEVEEALSEDSNIDIGSLSRKTGAAPDEIRASLAALGTRGLVGFDLDSGEYYHRVLPFELDKIEKLQPRLINARKLLDENKVRITKNEDNRVEAFVEGTDVTYFVRIGEDESKCTCPWYAKHQNERGPCKHILAVQLMLNQKKELSGSDTISVKEVQ